MTEWFDWLDWPGFAVSREGERMIRIEELGDGDALVIRADMPGIDPDNDVEIKVRGHMLEIRAERREDESVEEKGTRRSEFRYGSFYRTVPLPADAKQGDVQATYKDGVLEVRVPCAPVVEEEPQRIPGDAELTAGRDGAIPAPSRVADNVARRGHVAAGSCCVSVGARRDCGKWWPEPKVKKEAED
jgi:HSP20 family protein